MISIWDFGRALQCLLIFAEGSHIGNNMAFVLDDYPFDPSSGFYPSATGIQLLEGPLADPGDGIDNDRDSLMDENDERCGISSYIVFENANGLPMGNPATPTEYYNYMKGINTSLCPCTNQPTPSCILVQVIPIVLVTGKITHLQGITFTFLR
ncbi:MAG: hypothetical protein IPG39_13345 [Bacteroidetes bacterium]|nr:hypothetical protein [Bacteroidota bacterium]